MWTLYSLTGDKGNGIDRAACSELLEQRRREDEMLWQTIVLIKVV